MCVLHLGVSNRLMCGLCRHTYMHSYITGSTLGAPMEPLSLATLLEREREARKLDRAIGRLVEEAAAVGVAVERALDQARVAGRGACLADAAPPDPHRCHVFPHGLRPHR